MSLVLNKINLKEYDMSEATANSKEKNEIKVSTIILPENKNYESESLKYEIKIPNWLLESIQNYEVSNNKKFYEDKIQTAKFYFHRVLPRVESHYSSAISGSGYIMDFKFN